MGALGSVHVVLGKVIRVIGFDCSGFVLTIERRASMVGFRVQGF